MMISVKLLHVILTTCKHISLECCEVTVPDTLRVADTLKQSSALVTATHITLLHVSWKCGKDIHSASEELLYLLATAPSVQMLHCQAHDYDLIIPRLRVALEERKEKRLPALVRLVLAGLSRHNSLLANLFCEFCAADGGAMVVNVVV